MVVACLQIPFYEAPRTFTWRKTYIDVNSRVVDTTTTNFRIDLRESVFNFLRQEVYTKDTILVDVNALMYYSIGDVRKVCMRVCRAPTTTMGWVCWCTEEVELRAHLCICGRSGCFVLTMSRPPPPPPPPPQAIYEVEDLQGAISNVAQTQLKDVFGGMTFTHALESQEIINNHMRRTFAKVFVKWGINVHRIELQDLRPKSSACSPYFVALVHV